MFKYANNQSLSSQIQQSQTNDVRTTTFVSENSKTKSAPHNTRHPPAAEVTSDLSAGDYHEAKQHEV